MTIASEISRLQTAKADMKTAIVNKGVSVADSVSLSNYCDCINAISSGGYKGAFSYLVVGGGGGGGYNSGGGGGAVLCGVAVAKCSSFCVLVGGCGLGKALASGCPGCRSAVCWTGCCICAGGGCGGICGGSNQGGKGGSSGSGYAGGTPGPSKGSCPGGGGGGAGGAGCNATIYDLEGNTGSRRGGAGGPGLYGYGGGGGGAGSCYNSSAGGGCAIDGGGAGGGDGCRRGCNATNCGGGGGGGGLCCTNTGYSGGNGGCGVVEICYPSNGAWGITSATGGTKSTVTEGGVTFCKHRFTSSGTFTVVS